MKKIFFVFAMLLMSMSSALAESETINVTLEQGEEPWDDPVFPGDHFKVSGDVADEWGLYINGDNKFTIEAKNDELIKRVEFTISYGDGTILPSTGKVVGADSVHKGDVCEIKDVNKSSLTISSLGVYRDFQVSEITVYYEGKESKPFVMDEYVQTESFSIYGLTSYLGRNVTITGNGNGDGYDIANGNAVDITAKNNVKILKVDFGLSGGNNGSPIESTAGDVEGSDKDWTINNVNSSSLAISNSGTGNVKINSIKVYYVEMSGIQTEIFDVAYENRCSGKSVTIVGTENTNFDMELTNGNSVTITANSGVEISQVDLYFEEYKNAGSNKFKSTSGNVEGSGKNWTVKNIDSSTLTLSHPGVDYDYYDMWIGEITVHYKELVAPSAIEVVAKEVDGAYWTTFYSNASNYQAPEGTQVFPVCLDGKKINMPEIKDGIVTKGQGVVLKSDTKNIVMNKTESESSGDYSGNRLKGTSVSITNPGNAYVLSYTPAKGVGFYKLSATGTIGINKAYLVYEGSDSSANAHSFFAFDDVTTGIEINKVDGSEANDMVYDLQGRRVANPSNGIYIVNGKKVIMNKR